MLTTEDILNLDNIDLDASSAQNIDGHEDFIQQLSAELDIPMLLDQNGSVLTFESCEDELLSEVMTTDWPQCDTFDSLNSIDFACMDSETPTIKLEPFTPSSPESLYTESFKSHSPTPSQSSDGSRSSTDIKTEHTTGFDTPPVSPQEKSRLVNVEVFSKISRSNKPSIISTKINLKRVPIQPKPPYNVTPAKNKRKIVPTENFILNSEITSPVNLNKNSGKVVVLENVPVQSPTQVMSFSPVQISSVPVIYREDSNVFTISSDYDTKALKRQQRMIKNRESACLSRKKKKDYLTSLENEVADLKLENQTLKQENAKLRERLFSKTKGLAFTLPNKSSKNTAFLLAVLFMVSINVGSIRGLFNFNTENAFSPDMSINSETHHGRNLLWTAEIEPSNVPVPSNVSTDLTICPMMYVNQSESVRLAQELHRWIAKPYNNNSSAVKLKRKRKQFLTQPPGSEIRVPLYRTGRKNRRFLQKNLAIDNEIQVFKPRPETIYSEFFEAINRRDDTFYVVSFNADNMLLPALHHNNTRRPKMSLLLPAMLSNETSSDHSSMISLMQIDCEVLDTRLLHVKSNSIPQHLRTNYTRTEDFNTDNNITSPSSSNTNSDKLYKPYFIKNGSIKSHIDRLYSEKVKKVFKYN